MDPALRASIVYRLTQALAHTDQLAEAAAVADDESRQTTNARIRLRMQADHFVWSSFRTDEPDAPARSRRLMKLAERLTGRGLEERYILGLRAWDGVLRGEPRQAVLATAEEALRGGLSWTDENRGFEVPVSVALVFMYCDQPRRAEDLFTKGITECEGKGWRGSHLALGQTLYGYICYRRGFLIDAEELAREGLRTAEKVEGAVPAQWFAIGILIQTLLARGRTADARRIADTYRYGEVVPNAVIYPDPRSVYAELLIAEGRHAEAESLLSDVGEWLDGRGWRNPAWCRWQLNLVQAVASTDPDRALSLARDAVKRARDFGAASVIGQALRAEAEVTAELRRRWTCMRRPSNIWKGRPLRTSWPVRWSATVPRCRATAGCRRPRTGFTRAWRAPSTAVPRRWPPAPGRSSRQPGCDRCRCATRRRTRSPSRNAGPPN